MRGCRDSSEDWLPPHQGEMVWTGVDRELKVT